MTGIVVRIRNGSKWASVKSDSIQNAFNTAAHYANGGNDAEIWIGNRKVWPRLGVDSVESKDSPTKSGVA